MIWQNLSQVKSHHFCRLSQRQAWVLPQRMGFDTGVAGVTSRLENNRSHILVLKQHISFAKNGNDSEYFVNRFAAV
jgi:hypothetical protein